MSETSANSFNRYDPPSGSQTPLEITTTAHDALGRATAVTLPGGASATTAYTVDAATGDALATTIDANGHRSDRETDVFGRLASVAEYDGAAAPYTLTGTTRYGYDALDRATQTTDAAGNVATTSYNDRSAAGPVVTVADPDLGTTTTSHDVLGRVTQTTDALGAVIGYGYDALDRLIGESGGVTASYQYDSYPGDTNTKGRLVAATTGPSGTPLTTVHTQYDARGRATSVAQTTQGVGATFQYGYDELDRVARTTYPAPLNEQVTTTYDAAGRVASVCGTLCYASGVQYSAVSAPTQQTDGNGVVEQWTYDAQRLWLTRHQVGTGVSPSSVSDRGYSYDAMGNVATIADNLTRTPSATQHFVYDARDRLQHAWTTNDAQGYDETETYSPTGNLLTKGGVAYSYPAANQPQPHAPSSVGGQAYSYDLAGRLTAGGGRTLQWNAQGLPTSITAGAGAVVLPPGTPNLTASRAGSATAGTPNLTASRSGSATAGAPTTSDPERPPNTAGVTETYTYDGAGQRLTRTHDGMTTLYFGPWEVDVQGTTTLATRAQYSIGGQVVAQRTVAGASNTLVYLHGDHLGSVSVATSATGAVLDRQEYGPWGNIRSGGVAETTLNYTGQKRDGTGLLYYGARYYDPALGRFLSPDSIGVNPVNPQSLNRYSYVGNNPLNHTDPSGHCPDIDSGGVLGVCIPPDPTPTNPCDRAGVSCRPAPIQTPAPYKTPTAEPATPTPSNTPTAIPTPPQPSVITSQSGTPSATPSATPPEKATVEEVAEKYKWKDPYGSADDNYKGLAGHADEHGKKFGLDPSDYEGYASLAHDFYEQATDNNRNRGIEMIVKTGEYAGSVEFYEESTNKFGVYDSNGETVTFFKPDDDVTYWEGQQQEWGLAEPAHYDDGNSYVGGNDDGGNSVTDRH